MKKNLTFLFAVLLSMVSIKSFAHDIAVENSDGKTIYYIYTNNNTELAVSYRGSSYSSYSNEYSGDVVIPESVTYNGITYSVTSIGDYAFYDCTSLTSIAIPNSVTSIGSGAFSDCRSLTSINIPNSVTSIGEYAFLFCSGLKKVIVKDIAAWCGIKFDDYYSNPLYYAKHIYSDEDTEITNLIIPNSVTSIGENAFEDCTSLTSVTIPNSVTSIGDWTFDHCSSLTSITIPNSVTSIGYGAFEDCTSLTSITIPNSVKSIGQWVFQNCTSLTSITIPNRVTSIGECAFSRCSSLTSITIPNSVTSIGDYAFNDCTSLTSITIPNSVTWIGECAFYNCTSLTSITIPNSVTWIGECAFQNCTNLTSVSIGSGIQKIGSNAFAYCPDLADVYCHAVNVPIAHDAFYNSYPQYATLHVPDESIENYRNTNPWSQFGTIVGLSETTDISPAAELKATPVLIQSAGGMLTILGAADGTPISVFTTAGMQAGSTISRAGLATLSTNLTPGSIAIIKIGNRSVKVVLK